MGEVEVWGWATALFASPLSRAREVEQAGQGGELIRAWLVCVTFSLFSSPLPLLFLSALSHSLSFYLSHPPSLPHQSAPNWKCVVDDCPDASYILKTLLLFISCPPPWNTPPILTQPNPHRRLLFSLLIPLTLTKAFSSHPLFPIVSFTPLCFPLILSQSLSLYPWAPVSLTAPLRHWTFQNLHLNHFLKGWVGQIKPSKSALSCPLSLWSTSTVLPLN